MKRVVAEYSLQNRENGKEKLSISMDIEVVSKEANRGARSDLYVFSRLIRPSPGMAGDRQSGKLALAEAKYLNDEFHDDGPSHLTAHIQAFRASRPDDEIRRSAPTIVKPTDRARSRKQPCVCGSSNLFLQLWKIYL
jgi:hypothetical protein